MGVPSPAPSLSLVAVAGRGSTRLGPADNAHGFARGSDRVLGLAFWHCAFRGAVMRGRRATLWADLFLGVNINRAGDRRSGGDLGTRNCCVRYRRVLRA